MKHDLLQISQIIAFIHGDGDGGDEKSLHLIFVRQIYCIPNTRFFKISSSQKTLGEIIPLGSYII